MSIRQAKMKNIGILIHLSVCVIILIIIVEAQPPPPRGGNSLFNEFTYGVWTLVPFEFNAKFDNLLIIFFILNQKKF